MLRPTARTLFTLDVLQHVNHEKMKFSDQLRSKAIDSFQGELAWKKEDVIQAINELTDSGYAILGGDVWAVVKKHNNVFRMTSIDPENIAVGIIKGRDGQDYVFNWHSDRKSNEGWGEYLERSKNETLQIINKMNAEETVTQELQNSIFYNLVFANEIEYQDLI